jgi:energy-coupling factor transporter ATP-binding protein EcfA2
MLKDAADLVTRHDDGAGVRELIERLIAVDLRDLQPRLGRHDILLGIRTDRTEVLLQPHGTSVLLVGSSGSGKSTLAASVLERLADCEYQFCVVDPEGDYSDLAEAIVLGDSQHEPSVSEVFDVLAKPGQNVVVNLLGIALERRPAFFHALLPQLQELRAATGRPHWIVVDEAHHLLPASWPVAALTLPRELDGILFITVHPQLMAAAALSAVDLMIAVGRSPADRIRAWSTTLGLQPAGLEPTTLAPGEALAWRRGEDSPAFRFQMASSRGDRRRHQRKYAEGEIPDYHSFYFRGPQGKLNLRAQNLNLFLQLGDGVDDATWLHHLRRGDYSRWFRDVIRDEDLAAEASRVERDQRLDAQATRAAIHAAVEQRYTHSA